MVEQWTENPCVDGSNPSLNIKTNIYIYMNVNTRNLLLKLNNASGARLSKFYADYTLNNVNLIELLYEQGFIQSFVIFKKELKIFIVLRYFDNKPVFRFLKLLSTSLNFKKISFLELSRLVNKRFVLFLTTDKGYSTLYHAKKNHISGKILFLC